MFLPKYIIILYYCCTLPLLFGTDSSVDDPASLCLQKERSFKDLILHIEMIISLPDQQQESVVQGPQNIVGDPESLVSRVNSKHPLQRDEEKGLNDQTLSKHEAEMEEILCPAKIRARGTWDFNAIDLPTRDVFSIQKYRNCVHAAFHWYVVRMHEARLLTMHNELALRCKTSKDLPGVLKWLEQKSPKIQTILTQNFCEFNQANLEEIPGGELGCVASLLARLRRGLAYPFETILPRIVLLVTKNTLRRHRRSGSCSAPLMENPKGGSGRPRVTEPRTPQTSTDTRNTQSCQLYWDKIVRPSLQVNATIKEQLLTRSVIDGSQPAEPLPETEDSTVRDWIQLFLSMFEDSRQKLEQIEFAQYGYAMCQRIIERKPLLRSYYNTDQVVRDFTSTKGGKCPIEADENLFEQVYEIIQIYMRRGDTVPNLKPSTLTQPEVKDLVATRAQEILEDMENKEENSVESFTPEQKKKNALVLKLVAASVASFAVCILCLIMGFAIVRYRHSNIGFIRSKEELAEQKVDNIEPMKRGVGMDQVKCFVPVDFDLEGFLELAKNSTPSKPPDFKYPTLT